MAVTITISNTRLVSDDGGNFAPEQCDNKAQIRAEVKKRRRFYRRTGEIVNVDNQRHGGEVRIDITGKP